MQALADKANAVLLPLINAAVVAGQYNFNSNPYNYVDITAPSPNFIQNPQPLYVFNLPVSVAPANVIPASAVYGAADPDIGGFGIYTFPVNANTYYDYQPGTNEFSLNNNSALSGFAIQAPAKAFAAFDSDTFTLWGTAGRPVTANVTLNTSNWMREFNRIRADFFFLTFGEWLPTGFLPFVPVYPDLFQNQDTILSGPWCVAVNDIDTFPMGTGSTDFTKQGILHAFGNGMTLFKEVEFWCASDDADGLSMSLNFSFSNFSDTLNGVWSPSVPSTSFTLDCSFELHSGVAKTGVILNFTTSINPASVFTATGATIVAQDLAAGTFQLSMDLSVGVNSVMLSFVGPTGPMSEPPPSAPDFGVSIPNVVITGSTQADVQIISPNQVGTKIIQPLPTSNVSLSIKGTSTIEPNDIFFEISEHSVKGVWVAKTYPTPALNVFLDVDLPPMIASLGGFPQAETGYGNTAVAGDLGSAFKGQIIDNPIQGRPNPASPFQASAHRESVFLQDQDKNGNLVFVPTTVDDDEGGTFTFQNPKGNLVSQCQQPRATPWLVRRDTDFVPFDFGVQRLFFDTGYNPDEAIQIFSNLIAPGDGSAFNTSMDVPSSSTAVIIRLVIAGTGQKGWKSGSGVKQIVYGSVLPVALKIFVSKTGIPNPSDPSTYDFVTTNNDVTIPTDGGAGYLESIFGSFESGPLFFAIQNLSGNNLAFDMVTEIDFVSPPARYYFPPPGTYECFSYSVDGTPFFPGLFFAGTDESNPIPQNGHCIFKLRATRWPVKNASGLQLTPPNGTVMAAITATVGQNQIQGDGTLLFAPLFQADGITPFTITIDADARDSGDISVFWPVLGGNEIVYQCVSQIHLEAFVNWQPKFNFAYYARFPFTHPESPTYQFANQNPLVYQLALSFCNFYNTRISNYPPFNGLGDGDAWTVVKTQFLMSLDIYNDQMTCLDLI